MTALLEHLLNNTIAWHDCSIRVFIIQLSVLLESITTINGNPLRFFQKGTHKMQKITTGCHCSLGSWPNPDCLPAHTQTWSWTMWEPASGAPHGPHADLVMGFLSDCM